MKDKMQIVLINPPHSNPTAPPLGIAVLSAHLKSKGFKVKTFDLGLDAIYALLAPSNLEHSLKIAEEKLFQYNTMQALTYPDQCQYIRLLESVLVLKNFGNDLQPYLNIEKKTALFKESNKRNKAHFIINRLLEAIGCLFEKTYISAGDYRTDKSPFSTIDIQLSLKEKEDNIFYPFLRDWVNQFDWYGVKVVGISISFAKQMIPSVLLANEIKNKATDACIILGGSLFAHLNEEALIPLLDYVDGIIRGEGEIPLENVANARIHKEPLSTSCGVITKGSNSNLPISNTATYVDINDSSPPDFSDLPINSYITPHLVLPFQISRKCYWGKCTFCCLDVAFKHKNSYKKANTVVDHLKFMKEEYFVSHFEFVDDAIPPKFAEELSKRILDRRLNVNWFCYARLDSNFSYNIFQIMKEAGCWGLKFGLESASPEVLNRMQKGIDIEDSRRIIKQAQAAGMAVQLAFFIGFPGERMEDVEQTISFVKEHISNNVIVAYNGIFRCLKSMLLFKSSGNYSNSSWVKWNTDEDLIDYLINKNQDISYHDLLRESKRLEQELFPMINRDLARTVDLRRYWFSELENPFSFMKESLSKGGLWEINVPFNVNQIKSYTDINNGDFLPGEGIYATRSYIAKNCHNDDSLRFLCNSVPPVKANGKNHISYDPVNRTFSVQNNT